MSEVYETTHQYEPLRVPSAWEGDERRFIAQLTEIFDDLYRRFNRLRFEDFGGALKNRIENTEGAASEAIQTAEGISLRVNGVEGDMASLEMKSNALQSQVSNVQGAMSQVVQTAEGLSWRVSNAENGVSSLQLTTSGLAAAVNNNRLRFTASGLEIINSQGVPVFVQDNATGNLVLSGQIQASSGYIGGFLIEPNSLSNGTSIVLSSTGYVRLGKLTITDDKNYGPVFRGDGGLCFVVNGSLYGVFAEGKFATQVPIDAKYGLLSNPSRTTSQAPNVYMDPMTGELLRSTSSGGGGTSYATTSGTYVNIRSGPGTSYAIVGTIAASGTQVQITGVAQNGFYPVWWSGGDVSGWISGSYLNI